MASKDLKVNVIVNAKTKELDKMFKRLNRMQAQVNQQAKAQNAVTRAVQKTNAAHKKSGSLINGLTKKVHRLANAYLGVMGAKAALGASDTITKAENKLNNLNATALGAAGYTTDASGAKVYSQATLNATQQTMDKMYTSAQKVRMEYADMMNNVSKSMTLAGEAFGGNIDNAIRFQEVMSEAYTLSGASAAEMSSSMYQMIQGLGSGVLQGDELRSVREGASMAYKAIEEYAQGILKTDESLKDLAADGKITSDIVVKAILENGAKMDASFANTEMTFEQAWTSMKNVALKSFEPVLQKLNDLLNSPVGQAIVNGIGKAIQIVASLIGLAIDHIIWWWGILGNVFTFIQENWGIISKILTIIGIFLGVYLVTQAGLFIASLSKMAIVGMKSAISMIAQFFAMGEALGYPMAMAAMFGVTMNMWAWIALAALAVIIIVLVIISDSFADACGNIVGTALWLGATLVNIVIGVINAIIQLLWTFLAEPFLGIINWILTAVDGGFNGVLGGLANFAGQILNIFLSLGKVITKIIDALVGTDWSGELTSLQNKVINWGKKEGYTTEAIEAPEIQRISATGAFNKGYGYGEQFGNWTTDKLSGVGDKISGALNLGALPSADLASELGDIKGDTGKIADTMELTEEDLEYLRKVANMEWKKEFTTAQIKVDMTNNNTVSNDFDLNSLAIGLRDLVEEEMYAVANGVYS